MKRLLLAASLAMLAATPALAQTGKYDVQDWSWLNLNSDGPTEMLLLVGAPPVRDGDKAEMDVYIMYREVDKNGSIGGRIHARFDCAAATQAGDVRTVFYEDGRVTEVEPPEQSEMKPIDKDNVIYRAACTNNRDGITHVSKRPLRTVTQELFARYPAKP